MNKELPGPIKSAALYAMIIYLWVVVVPVGLVVSAGITFFDKAKRCLFLRPKSICA